jgi:hypothetical protein
MIDSDALLLRQPHCGRIGCPIDGLSPTRPRGRPRGPGKPISPTRGIVVALFDDGLTIAEIVVKIGATPQNVWVHLERAGRDLRQRYATRLAEHLHATRQRLAPV